MVSIGHFTDIYTNTFQYNIKTFAASCESKAQDTLQMVTPIDSYATMHNKE